MRKVTHISIFFILALLSVAMVIGAQSVSEAPAAFDGQTNGYASQTAMNSAIAVFSEVETPATGLGPVFNATSCAGCHQNIATGGAAQITELRAGHISRGEHNSDNYLHDSKRREDPNGSSATFTAATAVLGNGDTIPDRSVINQQAICPDVQSHLTANDNTTTPRLSLSVLGDGFVEAVPDATFLALAHQNGGEVIMVPVIETPNTNAVGRFGWKNQHASLLSFAGDAYFNEMGITNPLFPDEATTVCEPAGVPHPNDNGSDIANFALFMRATKVPPRGPITAAVNQGQAIFQAIGCANCHVSTLVTAPAGTAIHGGSYVIPAALGSKQFHPFGDFLLHDIGTGDGIQQNGPPDTMFKIRTAPLWGLRTRTQMLHDASAPSLEAAIQKHKNEAASQAQRFNQLSPVQQQQLLTFLRSL